MLPHRRGRLIGEHVNNTELVRKPYYRYMSPIVHTDDLIDSHEVAKILGLSKINSVSNYLKRYPDMPRPVVEFGKGRPRVWLRPEIQEWAERRRKRSAE